MSDSLPKGALFGAAPVLSGIYPEEDTASDFSPFDDPTLYKSCILVGAPLLSGSSDYIRQSLGGYFDISTPSGEASVDIEFVPFEALSPANSNLYMAASFSQNADGTMLQIPPGSISDNTIIPNKHYVCTVDGNPEHVSDDKMWKILWAGGTIDDVEYTPLYSAGTFSTYFTRATRPYPQIESRILKNPETVLDYIEVSYDYHRHNEDYENYVSGIESELLMPNWYILKWAGLVVENQPDILRTEIYNYISYNEEISEPWVAFSQTPGPENLASSVAVDNYLNTISSGPTMDVSTKTYIKERFKNIIFNDSSYDDYNLYSEAIMLPSASMPCYIKVRTNTDPTSMYFVDIVNEASFDTRLMRLLKVAFLDQSPDEISTSQISFKKYTKELSSSVAQDTNTETKTEEDVNYNAIGLVDLLLYSYAKIKCDIEDFTIIDYKSIETDSAHDTKGVYRSINAGSTLEVLDKTIKLFDEDNTAIQKQDLSTILNIESSTGDRSPAAPKPQETIAYRVEKRIPGNDSGEALQNFWFFNSDKITDFEFFDTQVKYDQNYTYKIYKYILLYGIKYQYSNLQLSRVIGATGDPVDEEGVEVDPETYCIEYYDPATGASVNDLLGFNELTYGTDPLTGDRIEGVGTTSISSLSTAAQRISVSRADPTRPPYLANFLLTVEPDLQIVEIPLFEKTLKIVDNPPNRLNVVPSYTQDDTNRLMFFASYETFYSEKYPNTISAEEVTARDDYLHAKDLLTTTRLSKELHTKSKQKFIEVYRIDFKPSSFEDFGGALLKSVDLSIEGTDGCYRDALFDDVIRSNQKYYYLFRAKNAHGIPGYVNEIMEAEIINDGGYKYAMFDTLFAQDLETDNFLQTTTDVKKVFQISPSIQQAALSTDLVDYADTAINQFENVRVGTAESLLWGKTFKIRLTSKKTNRQIDLNVTYNQTMDQSG